MIGLGNTLRGDDGIGAAVVRRLRRGVGREVLLEESTGDDLAGQIIGRDVARILIVDAADLGRAPGAWLRFSVERWLETKPEIGRLSHGLGLSESMKLRQALGEPPVPVVIFGVQPGAVGWAPGLSRSARRAVRQVAQAMQHELGPGWVGVRRGRCSGRKGKSVPAGKRPAGVSEERGGVPWPRSW